MRTYKTETVKVDASYGIPSKTKTFREDDIIILFMGETGSGKSQIIDTLTGQQGRRAGDSFGLVTEYVEASRILNHERYGSRIVLVDTPGFDDSVVSDRQTLELIGKWLKKTYEKRILLSGIVCVHQITHLRMTATPHRNFLMFAELIGPKSAKNAVLTTTMWDKLHPRIGDGDKREKQWKEKYWNVMIHHGAAVERFLNTSDSAWSIIDNIVDRSKNDQKAVLRFQAERVDQKKPLQATGASEALFLDFNELIRRQNYAIHEPVVPSSYDTKGGTPGTKEPASTNTATRSSKSLIDRLDSSTPAVTVGADESLASQNHAHEGHQLKTHPTFDHVSGENSPLRRTYKTESVQTSKLGEDDIIIAFTGPTGSGKSQIIDTLTGQQGRRAGDDLESSTQDLEASRILDHERYGSRIVLVDTPGFDDSTRTDKQILDLIGEWLTKTYERRILLSGVVYVHRITNTRMSATPHRNLLMFGELTGRRGTKNIVLATTMWDRLHPTLDDGNKRENGLKKKYWKVMIRHGAAVDRFLNTSDSAWSIVDNVVTRSDHKEALLFQEERVDKEKCLKETSAGEALDLKLNQLVKRQEKTMRVGTTWSSPLGIFCGS